MVPENFKTITEGLRDTVIPLSQMHAAARDTGSAWSADQLLLLFSCLDDWKIRDEGSELLIERAGQSMEEDLEQAMFAAVQSQGGRPMPAAVVMSLLPGRFTTSEAQLRKLAKDSSKLQVIGPGLIATR